MTRRNSVQCGHCEMRVALQNGAQDNKSGCMREILGSELIREINLEQLRRRTDSAPAIALPVQLQTRLRPAFLAS